MRRFAAAAALVVLGVVVFFTMGSIVAAIAGGVGFAVFGWTMTLSGRDVRRADPCALPRRAREDALSGPTS